ncbi:MAG: hypothetical protein ACE5HX_19380 [bacterium]
MKKYTIKQIKSSKSAIIVHPCFGTLGMEIEKASSKTIEGLVWDNGKHDNMPEDYRGEYVYMCFPITCIKKLY